MRIFRLRPLALGCAVFLLCLYTSYFLGNVFDIILISIGGLGFISLIAFNARKSTRRSISLLVYLLPVCACLVLSGIVALGTFYRDSRILEDNVGKEKECELLVTEERYSSNSEMVAIATDGETELLVAIPLENEQKISVGDTIKATAYIRELDNTGIGYNEKEYYLDKGIFMYAECEKYELISSGNFVFKQSLRKINSFLDGALKDSLNSDTASLTSAMLLGNKGALDGSIRRDFSRLGISHILALSGIHISLITAMLGALLNALMLRRRIKYLCLVSMICAFVGITGFSESAMRAGLMLMIFYTLSLFGKDSDSVTSLFVSMLLICILDPYAIFSTSLLLSFSAMIGCLCSAHYTRRVRPLYRIRPKFIRAIVYSLITSVTVVLFTLPIMMLRFDYVSLFAPVFNIFMVPPLTLLLYLAPFVLLIGWIPYLSLVVTFPSECIVRLCLWIAKNASRADFLTVSFVNVGQKIGVLLVLVAIILALVLSKKQYKYTFTALGVAILVFATASICTGIYRANTVAISSYDYRSSDIVAIESENEVMIIEMSSPSKTTTSQSGFYASHLGYSDIDTYVLTDYGHNILTAVDEITEDLLIRKLMLPTPIDEKEGEQFELIKQIAISKEIELLTIPEGYEFGEASVDFVDLGTLSRSTKRCVAFSISAHGSVYTYLGASAYETFDNDLENYVRKSDVIVLGAYGPKYQVMLPYDLKNVRYITFHGSSKDYVRQDLSEDRIKEPTHKFIFK